MKNMDKIVEQAIEEATKPRIFTLKRALIAAGVLILGTGVVAVIVKTAKDSHDDQEIDHNEVVHTAEKAAILQAREKKTA